jgi:ABC-type polysaccharide/polyol phosphate export permease
MAEMMTSSSGERLGGISELGEFANIVVSLMLRDIKTKYSGDVLGYTWALLAPLAWIAVIVVSFMVLGRVIPIFTDPVSFVLSGVVPYFCFRSTITAIARTNSLYRTVSFLAPVKRFHAILALALVELLNSVLVLIGLLVFNYVVFDRAEADKPLLVFYGIMLAWLLGFSFGHMFDGLAEYSRLFPRAIPIILRPMFLLSGVFYTANEMPSSFQALIAWNPLLHAVETVRNGMFAGYDSFVVVPALPLSIVGCMFLIGVIARRFWQQK